MRVIDDSHHEKVTMKVEKYRIVEWTSVFRDGTRIVEYELQGQTESKPKRWSRIGTSSTLANARKALLFHASNNNCGCS